jgi:hypothetical protein
MKITRAKLEALVEELIERTIGRAASPSGRRCQTSVSPT